MSAWKWTDLFDTHTEYKEDFLTYLETERQTVLERKAEDFNEYQRLLGERFALDKLIQFVTIRDRSKEALSQYKKDVGAKDA
jgi:hypothetical protein